MGLENLSVVELADRIRSREVSPVDVAQACLVRIERIDPAIKAWQKIDSATLMAAARRREGELDAAVDVGPLHGVPVGIKDIFNTGGLATTMGSPIFRDFVPDRDAEVVARLKRAGAVVIGKTVTTEFATFDPAETRNPWNVAHTPGGSSSGSAAAVAARMCPAAVGSQTVASIGRPAAFCGIVGLMPTATRTAGDGIFPVAWSLDHAGMFARWVDDVALMLDAMAETPIERPDLGAGFSVGVVREFFEEQTSPEAWRLHTELVDRVSHAGIRTIELSLPGIFDRQAALLRTILRAEVAAIHQQLHGEHAERYGPKIRGLIETGKLISSTDYLGARRVRKRYQREMAALFGECDVLISPGARGAAPRGLDYTGDPIVSAPWTLADFPTLSLPLKLDSSGMPVGIQLTAPPRSEGLLLEIGRWFEDFIGFNHQPRIARTNSATDCTDLADWA